MFEVSLAALCINLRRLQKIFGRESEGQRDDKKVFKQIVKLIREKILMGFAKQKILDEYREERLRSCKLYKAEYFPQDADSQKIGLSVALFILTPFDL